VAYLTYSQDSELNPNPIVDYAIEKFVKGRSYNSYIHADISDLWSRLVIIGLNEEEWKQAEFKDQKI
jgi:hypothetical protein